jgi:hypothetical protein
MPTPRPIVAKLRAVDKSNSLRQQAKAIGFTPAFFEPLPRGAGSLSLQHELSRLSPDELYAHIVELTQIPREFWELAKCCLEISLWLLATYIEQGVQPW